MMTTQQMVDQAIEDADDRCNPDDTRGFSSYRCNLNSRAECHIRRDAMGKIIRTTWFIDGDRVSRAKVEKALSFYEDMIKS